MQIDSRLRLFGLLAACAGISIGCAPQSAAPPAGPAPAAQSPSDPPEQSEPAVAQAAAPAADAASPNAEPAPPYFNPLAPERVAGGWISLFDGHTLYGWESNSPDVNWSVQDGSITADSGPIGLLNTRVPFADYEL